MLRKRVVLTLVLASLFALTGIVAAMAETVGYVTSTGLNIRKEPNTNSDILRCAKTGDALIILKAVDSWYYVKFNNVVYGYVAKQYVSTKPSDSSRGGPSSGAAASSGAKAPLPSKPSELGSVPNTCRPGDRNDHVKELQQALKMLGYYGGTCDGVYGAATEDAVRNFQHAEGLSIDGIAGNVTIRTLWGRSTAKNTGDRLENGGTETSGIYASGEPIQTLLANVTYYCPCSECCGKWAGGPTASGTMPRPGMVAMSSHYPFGTLIEINGVMYTVEDRGGQDIEKDITRVDIFIRSHQEAMRLGRTWTEAKIYRVGW